MITGSVRATSLDEHLSISRHYWDIGLETPAPGTFRSSTAFMSLPGLVLYREAWEPVVRLRGGLRSGFTGFALPGPERSPLRLWHRDLPPSWTVPWMSDDGELDALCSAAHRCTMLIVESGLVDAVAQAMRSPFADRGGNAASVLAVHPDLAADCCAEAHRLLDAAQSDHVLPTNPETERRVAKDVLCALLGAIEHPSQPPRGPEGTFTERFRLVQRCLEHARDHDYRLALPDLCALVNRSERAVRYAFQEQVGRAPIAYLRLRRLHRAHTALLFARPGERTVSSVAMRLGFVELGRFAAEYARAFGERPSETLHRDPPRGAVVPVTWSARAVPG